jgi:3'(2'), 5'-bisphosphate nucleotidase
MNFSQLVEIAIRASEEACNSILEVYNSNDFQTEVKGDNSPLTRADKNAHKVIVSHLSKTNLPILSEEGKQISYEQRKTWDTFWMVDPLDGTKEFLKRNGEFTVNIALIQNQKPILGVVALPVTGEVYYACRGEGAFVKRTGGTTQLERRPKFDVTKGGLKVVASRSHMSEETQAYIQKLKDPILVSKGSSLKFMLLAEGLADVYPRFAPTMEWDTAAAHAIVNEVGLEVIQKDTAQPLLYNKEDLLNPHFICL